MTDFEKTNVARRAVPDFLILFLVVVLAACGVAMIPAAKRLVVPAEVARPRRSPRRLPR